MKVIIKETNEVIAEVVTNHSMSLDDCLELVADYKGFDNDSNAVYEIGGIEYCYDDLDVIA